MKIFNYEIFKVRSRSERVRERERVVARTQQQDKIYIFDFVRAFACFYIVIIHFLMLLLSKHYSWRDVHPGIGMEMFFFTTGFLIPLSLERCNWKQFAVKRCFRLLPVLSLAVLVYTIIIKLGLINGKARIEDIITNITMTTDIFHIKSTQTLKHLIVNVSWSMQVELKFYIIAAIAFFFGKTMREKFFLLLSLCLFCYVFTIIFKLPRVFATSGCCFKLVSCCLLGSIYYFYRYKHISKVEFAFLTMCCLVLIFFGVRTRQKYLYTVGSLFVLFLVHFFTNTGNNKVVKYFANLSYSVYLFHYISVCYLNKNYPISVQSLNDVMFLFSYRMLLFIPIFIACHFIYYYIEKPAYDFGRRLASRIK